MIDCHAHTYPPQFSKEDLDELLREAASKGVTAIVTVPESLADCQEVLTLAAAQPLIQPCAGLHPVQPIHDHGFYSSCRCVQSEDLPPVLSFIRNHVEQLVAIGEIGLDFSPHIIGTDASLREMQQQVFAAQIQLANELNLPVNVHSRSAGHYVIDCLIANNAQGALLHAFDGKLGHALKGAAAGFYFSVPPSIVRSPQKQKMVKGLPLDNLLLETDSPALGPEKGVNNKPSNISIACAEVARIKGVSREEVAAITTANALKLFPKLKPLLTA